LGNFLGFGGAALTWVKLAGDNHTDELERDGVLDGLLGAVAGLADACKQLAFLVGDLGRPALRVALDQLRGVAFGSVETSASS